MSYRKAGRKIAVLLITIFMISCVSGCNNMTVETYENAEEFRAGNFSCEAADIKAIEIYWRSGKVNIEDTDEKPVSVSESGEKLSEKQQLHYCLKDGILEIRFAMSGEKLNISPEDKWLQVKIPQGIDLKVHSTSADVTEEKLEHDNILIATMSGKIDVAEVRGSNVDFSSNSGNIENAAITADTLSVGTSSGQVECKSVEVDKAGVKSNGGNISFEDIMDSNINVSTTSGDVVLRLPEDGVTVEYATDSGRFRFKTQQEYEKTGDLYRFGKGNADLKVQSSSGDLKIE